MCAYSKGDEVITISNNSKNQTEWDANCDVDNDGSETSILPGVDQPLIFDKDGENDNGLYIAEDKDFEYNYIYRGANPDNYLLFGGSCFRIMNVGKPGNYSVKIVYASEANEDGTCQVQGDGSITVKSINYTQQWQNSEIEVEFESWYDNYATTSLYGKLQLNKKEKESIKQHNFNTGKGHEGGELAPKDLKTLINRDESTEIYSGHVGLPNISDHIGASLNPLCSPQNSSNYSETEPDKEYPCSDTKNYMATSRDYWLMNPAINYEYNYLYIFSGYGSNGSVSSYDPGGTNGVRPVLYLESNIQFDGLGTNASPFILKKHD